ncbi:MAG: hypothetical protein JW776_09635 [Candidatus Lokiarchaeota archaeon]|nr:hypothetical protein [Candidatus Lokiarchaeota archaeon]
MNKEKRKLIIEQISTVFGMVWSFIGLIAGILLPMIYIAPLVFSSWLLFASWGHNTWANSYLMINYSEPNVYIPLYIIEAIFFVSGFIIFILGLIYMVKGRIKKEKLVKDGIYRYIRHPQNLGILLMIFPFTLYVPIPLAFPFHIDPGIRLGEILSWILIVALMSISSLIEEKILITKIGEDYLEYRSTTGFFFPRMGKVPKNRELILWKSVLLILGAYTVTVAVIFGVQRLLLELGLVFWTRTL